MQSGILASLGKIAGLAGIALGVFLLLFQGVLQKEFLPKAGLTSAQAFAVILSLMILTFGIAAIGIAAWLLGRSAGPKTPVANPHMIILSGLIVVVVIAAVYVGTEAKPDPSTRTHVEVGAGGVGIGGNVDNSTINVGSSPGSEGKPK
jgi:hypothetical protein